MNFPLNMEAISTCDDAEVLKRHKRKKNHLQCFTLCVLDEAERLALQQWMTGNHSGTENGVPQKVPGPRRNFLRLKRTQGRKSTNLWHQIRSWASSIFPTLSRSEHDLSTYGRRRRRSAKLHNKGFPQYACWGLGMNQLTSTSLYLCDLQTAFRYSKYDNGFLWSERKSQRRQKESLC